MLQFILLAAFLIPAVLFLLTQQNTLKAVKRENRSMSPGWVWLQVIPVFGQVWQFFVILRIANSIKKELASRQDDSILGFSDASAVEETGKRPTFALGIAYSILIMLPVIANVCLTFDKQSWAGDFVLMFCCSLVGMTCWIIYWVRLVHYKKRIQSQH